MQIIFIAKSRPFIVRLRPLGGGGDLVQLYAGMHELVCRDALVCTKLSQTFALSGNEVSIVPAAGRPFPIRLFRPSDDFSICRCKAGSVRAWVRG